MTNAKDEMKKEALKMTEKVIREAIESAFTIADIAIRDSENKIDDLILSALPLIKSITLKYVDKISEEV